MIIRNNSSFAPLLLHSCHLLLPTAAVVVATSRLSCQPTTQALVVEVARAATNLTDNALMSRRFAR